MKFIIISILELIFYAVVFFTVIVSCVVLKDKAELYFKNTVEAAVQAEIRKQQTSTKNDSFQLKPNVK